MPARLPAAADGHGSARAPIRCREVQGTQVEVGRVATIEQCMTALQGVLGDIASHKATQGLDRSVSCRFPDLGQAVLGRLSDGAFHDLTAVDDGPDLPRADVRLT